MPCTERPSLLATVRSTVARHVLLAPGDRVLVAVSGGPDSVALLHALALLRAEYDLTLGVCHVHHGLRPEADGDAAFVEALAAGFGCAVTVERVRVRLGAGRSPEDAARMARYAALGRAARRFGATRIAVGHTAGDQAETVLMRVLDGAGPRGLAGIPVRRGRLVRPLLECDRSAVLAHLAAHELAFVEDATNRDPGFARNRIRHEVLPFLVTHGGPRLPDALRRIARTSREAIEALDTLVRPRLEAGLRPGLGGWTLDLAALGGLPPGAVKALFRLALVEALGAVPIGLRAAHLEGLTALLGAPVGARVRLPGGFVVERGRTALSVAAPITRPEAVTLAVPGQTRPSGWPLRLEAEIGRPPPGRPADPAWEVWFDADVARAPLVLRAVEAGDRLVPFGGTRPVRVNHLLATAGIARVARARWPALVAQEAGGGETLVWLVGIRRGAAAPVTSEAREVLRVRATVDLDRLRASDP